MKRVLIIGLSLFFSGTLFGQDLILKRNGDEILAIIISVDKKIIQYREFHDSRGRIRKIDKPEIHKIVYSSGTEWIINPPGVGEPDPVAFQKKKDKYGSARKPGDAMFYSVVLSGGGQFYNKQPVKGGILMGLGLATLGGGIISYKLDGDPGITVLCFLHYAAAKIYSIIDAPVSAVRINELYELSVGSHSGNGRFTVYAEPVIHWNQNITISNRNPFPVFGIKLTIPIR